MQSYLLPLIPGPVSVPQDVLAAYAVDYGSADVEAEFFELYCSCERSLQHMLATDAQISILSGEGMLALWSALKSVVRPGERVLAVATGVFGYGIGDMARQIGAEVEVAGFGYRAAADLDVVRAAALRFRPRLITAVHCETPSGTLNPIAGLGEIARETGALLYVDFVASGGGVPVLVDEWGIDLGLLGSQKALSCMPDLSMVTVSAQAWAAIDDVGYVGYDALQPWRTAVAERYLPYTHNWQAMAGLRVALNLLEGEGWEAVYQRHAEAAALCQRRLHEMGVALWPEREEFSSPTVTAAHVPHGWTWERLDAALRQEGLGARRLVWPFDGQGFPRGPHGVPGELGPGRNGHGCTRKNAWPRVDFYPAGEKMVLHRFAQSRAGAIE